MPLNHIDWMHLETKFVTKEDLHEMKVTVGKHDKVYNRVQNLLIYIGVLATFQLVFGSTWREAATIFMKVFGK